MGQRLSNSGRGKKYRVVGLRSWEETEPYRKYAAVWSVFICEDLFKMEITNEGLRFYVYLADGYECLDAAKYEANAQPRDEYGVSMIGVLVNKDGEVVDITSRWNLMDGSENITEEQLWEITKCSPLAEWKR